MKLPITILTAVVITSCIYAQSDPMYPVDKKKTEYPAGPLAPKKANRIQLISETGFDSNFRNAMNTLISMGYEIEKSN